MKINLIKQLKGDTQFERFQSKIICPHWFEPRQNIMAARAFVRGSWPSHGRKQRKGERLKGQGPS
jgi:hypothetical protein